jgi:putative FmdB family regulatory protein
MPLYEFECSECGVYTRRMSIDHWDTKQDRCDCGRGADKIPSCSSFELKGGGWYAGGYTKSG